jgi:hypothetical protein
MPNNRFQSYENYNDHTQRRAHFGEGRRLRNRHRDYFDDYNDFEDNYESQFSYADDDDNPLYAQPGFSGEQSALHSLDDLQSVEKHRQSQVNSPMKKETTPRSPADDSSLNKKNPKESYHDDFEPGVNGSRDISDEGFGGYENKTSKDSKY